jgi:hypothetical protein
MAHKFVAYPSRVPSKSQPGTLCRENKTLDLKQMDEIALRALLKRRDSVAVEAKVLLKIPKNTCQWAASALQSDASSP